MRRALGDRRGIAESLEGVARVVFAEGRPDRAVSIWGAARQAGRAMTLEQAIDAALAKNVA